MGEAEYKEARLADEKWLKAKGRKKEPRLTRQKRTNERKRQKLRSGETGRLCIPSKSKRMRPDHYNAALSLMQQHQVS
jgi:hypothetical protein